MYCTLSLGYVHQIYLMITGHVALDIRYHSNLFSSLLDVPAVLALSTAIWSTRAIQVSTTQ